MEHKSTWRQFEKSAAYPALEGPLKADVAIVGGGLTGVLAAYLLKDSGLSIALVEQEALGYRASGSTTAFLMELIDTGAKELIATHGKEKAKRVLDSHRDAIRLYEETSAKEGIACEFTRTPLFAYARDAASAKELQQEAAALRELGRAAEWKEDQALGIKNAGYFRLGEQGKFHPLKFLYGLAERAAESGVKIFEHSRVDMEQVEAKWILAATHYPPDPQPKSIYFKKASYLTYVLEAHIPRGTLPEGLYEDTDNPYHYLRVDHAAQHDRLLVGGADHRMDVPLEEEKAYAALRAYIKEVLPGTETDITREWKGMIVEPGDGLALIGPVDDPRVFYATGYSGNGITYAAIAAQLFRDHVLGKKSEYEELYAANRPFDPIAHAKGAAHYAGEFLGGMGETS